MANLFEKLNKQTKLFNVEVENPVFKKINQFNVGDVLNVKGMYTNKKSRFGDEPVFIVKDVYNNIFFVKMPNHHLETLTTIITDKEMIDGINNGECFIKIISYYSKRFNKTCFDFEFCDKSQFKQQNTPTFSANNNDVQEDVF